MTPVLYSLFLICSQTPPGDALPSVTRLAGLNVWNSKPIFLLFSDSMNSPVWADVRFERDVDFLLVYFSNAFNRFEKHTNSPTPLFSESKVITRLITHSDNKTFLTNICQTYWKCWCVCVTVGVQIDSVIYDGVGGWTIVEQVTWSRLTHTWPVLSTVS